MGERVIRDEGRSLRITADGVRVEGLTAVGEVEFQVGFCARDFFIHAITSQ